MNKVLYLLVVIAILFWSSGTAQGQRGTERSAAALQGAVSSQAEGPMEGVIVKAKREGTNITVTVVSNNRGQYFFPAKKLAPGQYSLNVRAAGYELEAPKQVEIVASKTATLDLKLASARDVASQLSNAEWLLSFPDSEQKEKVDCVGCHTLETIARSRHKGDAWYEVLTRMRNYVAGSSLRRPQKYPIERGPAPKDPELVQYLSSINLSSGKWNYELKTFPRPTGRDTQVVITEYDLPTPAAQPHDVVVDQEGLVWYSDFGRPVLGKLDPRTGAVTEISLPIPKPGYPEGSNPTEVDEHGNIYVGMLKQAALARFDRKTGTVQHWSIPEPYNTKEAHLGMIGPVRNGVLWFSENPTRRMFRIDTKAGKIESYPAYPDEKEVVYGEAGYMFGPDQGHSIYGLSEDSKGNGYVLDINGGTIGKIEPGTGKVTLYATPTPNSGPRRGMMDAQDRLWFAEFRAGKVAMFDTKTGKFQEWAAPGQYAKSYDAKIDKNGEVWSGGMHTDYVYRLDPKTGEWVRYLLPTSKANLRRMAAVDNSTSPVTVYVGMNHQAKIAKIEPLN